MGQWVVLALSLASGALIASPVIAELGRGGFLKPNYRGEELPCPSGLAILATALILLAPLSIAERFIDEKLLPGLSVPVITYVIGVSLLGLVDDSFGRGGRGFRGHWQDLARGRVSTGALKALGTVGLAFFVLTGIDQSFVELLVEVAVLALATNMFNMLDLRPGRAIKIFVLLGAGLCAGKGSFDLLKDLGLFVGPILALLPFDLRRRAMLGDTGSTLVGAVAGVWLVLSLSVSTEIVALALLVALTVYGEFRSLGSAIERTPLLRRLDLWGRA